MKWGIISIVAVGILVFGVFGAVMAHGGEATVSTQVYIVKDKAKVDTISPGDNVTITVEVKNTGNSPYALSGHAPVFAYADIYRYEGGEKYKVQSVKFESKYVMWHVVELSPGEVYTAHIDWTVPDNVSGILYIEAWAGSAPKSSTTVTVSSPSAAVNYDNSMVYVYTDELVYFPGDVVHITIVNHGDSPALFGSGFVVEDDNGNVVTSKIWRHEVVLQPGEAVEYTWTVPDDISEGWYYIFSNANNDYAVIYIY